MSQSSNQTQVIQAKLGLMNCAAHLKNLFDKNDKSFNFTDKLLQFDCHLQNDCYNTNSVIMYTNLNTIYHHIPFLLGYHQMIQQYQDHPVG